MIKLINEFGKMPGIGQKTAERLACHVLKQSPDEAMQLAYAIRDVKVYQSMRHLLQRLGRRPLSHLLQCGS